MSDNSIPAASHDFSGIDVEIRLLLKSIHAKAPEELQALARLMKLAGMSSIGILAEIHLKNELEKYAI